VYTLQANKFIYHKKKLIYNDSHYISQSVPLCDPAVVSHFKPREGWDYEFEINDERNSNSCFGQ